MERVKETGGVCLLFIYLLLFPAVVALTSPIATTPSPTLFVSFCSVPTFHTDNHGTP